ncbi:MAG: glycosyltransferase family 39 protein [Anaerolineae bacterium]|nr:glycosyltransferase family 39 protein [Anaerolineae bacterium]
MTFHARAARRALLVFAVIAIFGLFVRLWHIERESFWADEGWTMLLAKGPTLADVARTMADDQHPPLYFMLIRLWMDVFGDSLFMTRLLSTFWSLICLAAVYRLSTDWFSPAAGLVTALLLALTDNEIMLAREVRHYTQLAALAALSALFYLRYARRPSRISGVAWLLSSIALLYTHYLGVLLIAVQVLHTLLVVRPFRRLPDMLFRFAALGIAFLPQFGVFLMQSSVRYTRPIIFQSTFPNTPETFVMVRTDLIGTHFGLTGALALLGLVYVSYRFGKAHWRWRPLLPTSLLALWVALPIMVIIGINERFPILTTRNFLLVTPALVILIGHGILNLDQTARRIILAALVFVNLTTIDAYHIKPPWRELAHTWLTYREADDALLMDIWVDDFALRYHIGQELKTQPEQLPLVSLPAWRETYREFFFARLHAYLEPLNAFWLVYWGKNEDGLLDFLPQRGFQRVAELTAKHYEHTIYLWRYERPPQARLATFGDLFALERANVDRQADTVRVTLLWRALRAPALDYSVSAFLLDSSGRLVAQHDGVPLNGNAPTSAWRAGDLKLDSHRIVPPPDLPSGEYTVGVKVYWYADLKPLSVNDAEYFVLGTLRLP